MVEEQDWRLFQVARPFRAALGRALWVRGPGLGAPARQPSSRAPQRLGPTRSRPLHPRAARGRCLSVRTGCFALGLWAAQTPSYLLCSGPVRGRLRESVVFLLHVSPLSVSEAVTLELGSPCATLRRLRCRALSACVPLGGSFFSSCPQQLLSGRRGGWATSGAVVSQLPPRAAFPTASADPKTRMCPLQDEPALPQA